MAKQVDISQDVAIDSALSAYRTELLAGMNRYHGCDAYDNERSCRADVYRVDHVIYPVVRQMLEDWVCHCGALVVFGYDGDRAHHRGMCVHCDSVRCDVEPEACGR